MSDNAVQNGATMNRGGRPKKAPENLRNKCVMVRMTDDEYAEVSAVAQASKTSIAEFFRHTGLAASGATETIALPLSEDDRKAISLRSIEAGYNLQEYCLATLRNMEPPSSRQVTASMVSELNRIGINLDQCLLDHRIGKGSKPELESARKELSELLERLAAQL